MMWRSLRSAKSVAWIRLNVIGVSMRFFLPRRVTSRTSGDEFHSLKYVPYPSDCSHVCSNASWVLLPEPSMPSTTKRRPGNDCSSSLLMTWSVTDCPEPALSNPAQPYLHSPVHY